MKIGTIARTLARAAVPAIALAASGGCASVAVTSDTLAERTAFALGIGTQEFTISDRVDSGVRTDYRVQTRDGTRYACYVTGIVSVTGRSVSDAICSRQGAATEAAKPADAGSAPASCNALLKAAGKC
ncbi:hypothetical protein [Stenotrophomonas sp. MMGLT7]|uniref:hypothetical protein n=1 Tax=Stenotrophomonas sp. MMGLT7 TaxID=2901227 RepID=UPI001E4DE4B3|nr:hypothetical protein [Stenotrophomonas sp. MMGLT7]MCD7098983.1 hypothetical protein [Stenotrophomonas sp. MMGLT7]